LQEDCHVTHIHMQRDREREGGKESERSRGNPRIR